MLILHSDVITYHVEQCETSAYKEEIRKDWGLASAARINKNSIIYF